MLCRIRLGWVAGACCADVMCFAEETFTVRWFEYLLLLFTANEILLDVHGELILHVTNCDSLKIRGPSNTICNVVVALYTSYVLIQFHTLSFQYHLTTIHSTKTDAFNKSENTLSFFIRQTSRSWLSWLLDGLPQHLFSLRWTVVKSKWCIHTLHQFKLLQSRRIRGHCSSICGEFVSDSAQSTWTSFGHHTVFWEITRSRPGEHGWSIGGYHWLVSC